MPILADAWFIHAATNGKHSGPAELVRGEMEIDDLQPNEVLLAPLFGSWEGNMTHAIDRDPIDICEARGYERCVIGNSGVARIVELGADVTDLKEGQVVLMGAMDTDAWGYPKKLMAYDMPVQGLMRTRMKLRSDQVLPLPENTRHDLTRWAAFNVRYPTAWDNWRIAHGTFRLLINEEEFPRMNVWAWGGGTALAEAHLATLLGHSGVAIASTPERKELIESMGVKAVDRTNFPALQFDERRYKTDEEYAAAYRDSETAFLATVAELTGGLGVQVFVDLIGEPVFRATLKALGRQGIVATAGWKVGMRMKFLRAVECIARHQFIHTHFAPLSEARKAIAFAEENEWLPIIDERIYDFDEIPELAANYAAGKYRMFPVYRINGE